MRLAGQIQLHTSSCSNREEPAAFKTVLQDVRGHFSWKVSFYLWGLKKKFGWIRRMLTACGWIW